MTEFCKHHLREPAHWECHNCGSYYCHHCIITRSGGYTGNEKYYFCPACATPADWIAPSNVIRPFWERLHTFFAYPLTNLSTLVFILSIAVISAFFSGPGLINGMIKLGLFVLLMKYSFTAMASTAKGALSPPAVDLKALSDDAQQAFVPTFLTGLIFYIFFFVTKQAGIFTGIVCLILGFLALPSMIMSYMAKGNIFHAVNPVLFIGLMLRIGRAYLLMVFFLFLLLLAPNVLIYTLGRLLLPGGMNFLFSFANAYYTIIFYHLMGYVLLQFHREIGYTINQEDFIVQVKASPESQEVNPAEGILAKIEFLAKEGKYEEALEYIKKESRGTITDPVLSRQFFKLLKLKNDPEFADHLVPHLEMMITQNDKQEACDVFLTSISKKIQVSLPDPALIKLAGWLNESGSHREAVSVYSRIISGKSGNGLVPMAYFRAACILYEKLNDKTKADKIFRMLKTKYPMDDIIPHVDNYLRKIQVSG